MLVIFQGLMICNSLLILKTSSDIFIFDLVMCNVQIWERSYNFYPQMFVHVFNIIIRLSTLQDDSQCLCVGISMTLVFRHTLIDSMHKCNVHFTQTN